MNISATTKRTAQQIAAGISCALSGPALLLLNSELLGLTRGRCSAVAGGVP